MSQTQTAQQIIAEIIKKEGGYVNHPADRGGPTNFGITIDAYDEYYKTSTPASKIIAVIQSVTKEIATRIYTSNYYVRPKINQLPEQIAPMMLDMAVNHGPGTAIKILQKCIGATPDGCIGAKTIQTCSHHANKTELVNKLVDARKAYYKKIIAKDPTQAVFENGWMTRAESFRINQ